MDINSIYNLIENNIMNVKNIDKLIQFLNNNNIKYDNYKLIDCYLSNDTSDIINKIIILLNNESLINDTIQYLINNQNIINNNDLFNKLLENKKKFN